MNHEWNQQVLHFRSVFASFTSIILISQCKTILGRLYSESLIDRLYPWIIAQYILVIFLITQLLPIKRIRRFKEISTLSWNFLWAWIPTSYMVKNYEIHKDTSIDEISVIILILSLIYIPIFFCIRSSNQ